MINPLLLVLIVISCLPLPSSAQDYRLQMQDAVQQNSIKSATSPDRKFLVEIQNSGAIEIYDAVSKMLLKRIASWNYEYGPIKISSGMNVPFGVEFYYSDSYAMYASVNTFFKDLKFSADSEKVFVQDQVDHWHGISFYEDFIIATNIELPDLAGPGLEESSRDTLELGEDGYFFPGEYAANLNVIANKLYVQYEQYLKIIDLTKLYDSPLFLRGAKTFVYLNDRQDVVTISPEDSSRIIVYSGIQTRNYRSTIHHLDMPVEDIIVSPDQAKIVFLGKEGYKDYDVSSLREKVLPRKELVKTYHDGVILTFIPPDNAIEVIHHDLMTTQFDDEVVRREQRDFDSYSRGVGQYPGDSSIPIFQSGYVHNHKAHKYEITEDYRLTIIDLVHDSASLFIKLHESPNRKFVFGSGEVDRLEIRKVLMTADKQNILVLALTSYNGQIDRSCYHFSKTRREDYKDSGYQLIDKLSGANDVAISDNGRFVFFSDDTFLDSYNRYFVYELSTASFAPRLNFLYESINSGTSLSHISTVNDSIHLVQNSSSGEFVHTETGKNLLTIFLDKDTGGFAIVRPSGDYLTHNYAGIYDKLCFADRRNVVASPREYDFRYHHPQRVMKFLSEIGLSQDLDDDLLDQMEEVQQHKTNISAYKYRLELGLETERRLQLNFDKSKPLPDVNDVFVFVDGVKQDITSFLVGYSKSTYRASGVLTAAFPSQSLFRNLEFAVVEGDRIVSNVPIYKRPASRNTSEAEEGDIYFVSIAQEKYVGQLPVLSGVVNGMQEVSDSLEQLVLNSGGQRNYYELELTDIASADYENMVNRIAQFLQAAKAKDLVVLYYTGHGYLRGKEQQLYLPFVNGDSHFAVASLLSILHENCHSNRKVVIINSCYSGALIEDDFAENGNLAVVLRSLPAFDLDENICLISSASKIGAQFIYQESGLNAFNKLFALGLTYSRSSLQSKFIQNENSRGKVSIQDIYRFILYGKREISLYKSTGMPARFSTEVIKSTEFEPLYYLSNAMLNLDLN